MHTVRPRALYTAAFVFHFSVIVGVSCREAVFNVARGLTFLPGSCVSAAERIEPVVEGALGRRLSSSNPVRVGLSTYWELAGVEGGYGYFAPNVPGTYKLVLELHYPEGGVEYALPRASSAAAGLRLVGLLDEIGRTRSEPLREYMVRSIAQATWREHPDAVTVRAVFGTITPPRIGEFEQGQADRYRFLFAYDFTRGDASGREGQ